MGSNLKIYAAQATNEIEGYPNIHFSTYFKEGENNINLKDIYIFYGCTLQGVRKFITAVIANNYEKTSEWYNLFLILKRRNIENILYTLLPDNKLLKDAIKLAFPEVETFVSCFEAINKINKYYPQGYCSKVFKLIKNIYLSETSSDYNIALVEFKLHYGSSNFIMDLLEKDFKYAKDNYCYNLELRNIYRGLAKIEETFKITKSEFNARPINVRLEDHIDAHFLICFISLVIIRILQSKTNDKYTIKNLLEKMKNFKCTHETSNLYKFIGYKPEIQYLNRILELHIDKKYDTRENIKKILKY